MQIKPKKSLGQNFLINSEIIEKIINCVKIDHHVNILEVGPGSGNLTKEIISKNPKSLHVVEKDKNLCDLLNAKFNKDIKVINNDILNVKLNDFDCGKFIIFGNLPYNISTQILVNWILYNYNFTSIKKLVLMFQKEVADRILSKVNEKNYGRLSIIANWKFDIKKEFDIDPSAFSPRPKVQSTVLSMLPKSNFFKISNPKNLEMITSIFFNQRRKMIKKSLNKILTNNSDIIKNLNIDTNLRPQNLSPKIYFQLAEIYSKLHN